MPFKTTAACAVTAALVSAAFLVAGATRLDHHEQDDAQMTDEAKMMQAYAEAGQPGDMHAMLEHFVGKWDVTAEFEMGGDTMTSNGTSTVVSIYGGRFIRETFGGEMMGEAFEGTAVVGYDKVGRKFQSVWFDMMSTAMLFAEGSVSADGKTMTFTGMGPDPLTGAMKPYMHVSKIIDDNKHVFEMYESGDGGMVKSATMTYTRAD